MRGRAVSLTAEVPQPKGSCALLAGVDIPDGMAEAELGQTNYWWVNQGQTYRQERKAGSSGAQPRVSTIDVRQKQDTPNASDSAVSTRDSARGPQKRFAQISDVWY